MSASPAVLALADRLWAGILALSPTTATMFGDESSADRWEDPSAAGRAREAALIAEVLAAADAIDPAGLDLEDAITLDLVRVIGQLRRRAADLRLWQLDAIDHLSGPQSLPSDLARIQRVDSPERIDRLVARLEAYPALMDAHIANIREGREAGRTASRIAVERVLTQTRRAIETPVERSALLASHPELAAADRARIEAALAGSVTPALRRWADELEAYLPHARAGEGICWLPDGEELYRYHVLAWTTLESDPGEIHAYGLKRIAVNRAEMEAIAAELGFADVAALRAHLAADPANHAADPADLVRLARDQIARTEAVAPAWFGRLPAASVEVRAVEPHQEQEAPPAFYLPASPDGSRPGIYFINTFDPASRPLHRIASTTFHEAVPGHHFQLALEAEHPSLPALRRLGARLAGSAYSEGWGLYSERLADEMGLYLDARERFGMLEAEAWRAARLVVDTGLHAFRWTREQSMELLREAAGLSALEAETETDRYIIWPGQALSYMTGQREIERLRRELEARDGDRFDLRAFHDAVLGHGSLPLATLRSQLPAWVAPRAASGA